MSTSIVLAAAVAGIALAPAAEAWGQARLLAPVISSVAPQDPTPSAESQLLTINGQNFLAGVSVSVLTPDGRTLTYGGPAIRARLETSFQVTLVLAAAGAYTLTATNLDGGASDPFVLKVQPSVQPPRVTPRIDRVLPDILKKDPQPQILTIRGQGFVQGLSVSLTDPMGTVFLFKGPAVGAVTTTSFDLSVVLEMVGDYSLMVTNPSGESSSNVMMTVVMGGRRPR